MSNCNLPCRSNQSVKEMAAAARECPQENLAQEHKNGAQILRSTAILYYGCTENWTKSFYSISMGCLNDSIRNLIDSANIPEFSLGDMRTNNEEELIKRDLFYAPIAKWGAKGGRKNHSTGKVSFTGGRQSQYLRIDKDFVDKRFNTMSLDDIVKKAILLHKLMEINLSYFFWDTGLDTDMENWCHFGTMCYYAALESLETMEAVLEA